jgi:hypothetical protein
MEIFRIIGGNRMKITIYELLGMIKEGKAPKRFKYDSSEWLYDYESSAYWNDKGVEFENYMDDGLMKYLNEEVEIIEPQEHKIPSKRASMLSAQCAGHRH